jgi:hypothetical protein
MSVSLDRYDLNPNWIRQGVTCPSKSQFYEITRNPVRRKELQTAGVLVRENNRWLWNPARYTEYLTGKAKQQARGATG